MSDVKIDPKLLKSLGELHTGFPEEPIPYNPAHPNPFGIQKANEPHKKFEFGIDMNLPKKGE